MCRQCSLSCHTWHTEGGKPNLVLPLHKPAVGQDYFLGLFLGGVYQEVMGSAHNMLGSTHVVQVKLSSDRRLDSGGHSLSQDLSTTNLLNCC